MKDSQQILRLILLLAAMFGFNAASALPDDSIQPMYVEADSFEAHKRSGVSVFRGNVLITKGSITIKAEEARLRVEQDEIMEATILGSPAEFSQQPGEGRDRVQGWANRIEYNADQNLIDLVGAARLIQGQDLFESETIRYNTLEEKVLAKSSERPQERVVITFMPKESPPPQNQNPEPDQQQQEPIQ